MLLHRFLVLAVLLMLVFSLQMLLALIINHPQRFNFLLLVLNDSHLFLFVLNVFVQGKKRQKLLSQNFKLVNDFPRVVQLVRLDLHCLQCLVDLHLHLLRHWEFGLESVRQEHHSRLFAQLRRNARVIKVSVFELQQIVLFFFHLFDFGLDILQERDVHLFSLLLFLRAHEYLFQVVFAFYLMFEGVGHFHDWVLLLAAETQNFSRNCVVPVFEFFDCAVAFLDLF